jgi:hypothetical protein
MDTCPFKVGDVVIYRPSGRGLALDIMASATGKLIPEKQYTVAAIQNNNYVLVAEYNHPGGGIFWQEFSISEKL